MLQMCFFLALSFTFLAITSFSFFIALKCVSSLILLLGIDILILFEIVFSLPIVFRYYFITIPSFVIRFHIKLYYMQFIYFIKMIQYAVYYIIYRLHNLFDYLSYKITGKRFYRSIRYNVFFR
jgi:hypothetical protein